MIVPENEKINVIFDVDLLGLGHVHAQARTGVYRVTEELLKRFIVHPKLNLYLASPNYLYDSVAYLKKNDFVKQYRFVHSQKDINRNKYLYQVTNSIRKVPALSKVIRKFYYTFFSRQIVPFDKLPDNAIYFSAYYPIPSVLYGDGAVKKVLVVHDLIAFRMPELFTGNLLDVQKSIQSADEYTTFVCVSKSTKQDLKTFFPNLKNSARVIPLAASRELFFRETNKAKIDYTLRKYGIPNRPYLLSLCTLEPRKNIETTIRAFIKLLKEHHEINASLVLVGTLGWKYKTIFEEIMNSGQIKNHLIITGFVEDQDLAAIYSGASAFMYPSLFEGFGLPPLEAMQCGVPVVVSNTSSIPEVVGEAGIYVEPMDKIAVKDAMDELLTNRVYFNELSEKSLLQAGQFSWKKSVDKYVNIFKKLTEN